MAMRFCKHCGKQFDSTIACPYCGTKVPVPKVETPAEHRAMLKGRGLMEYKVIGAEDEWLHGGRFDKTSLESMLNSYAEHGWRVKEMVIGKTTGLLMGFSRDEMMIVLEREMDFIDMSDVAPVGGETKIGDYI